MPDVASNRVHTARPPTEERHPDYTADLNLIREHVPACLRERDQWVCWMNVTRDGKSTKLPISPTKGGEASTTDPSTWGSFQAALTACHRSSDLSGIGYVFSPSDPHCGIDLDNCIAPDNGQLKPWAKDIVARFTSYTEVSPSGHGVKIFIRGSKPGPRCKKKHEDWAIEIYDHARFFTFTGRRLPDTPGAIHDRQVELDEFYGEVFGNQSAAANDNGASAATAAAPNPQAPRDDDDVIGILRKSKCGEAFDRVWKGQWQGGDKPFGSQSEADLALVSYIVFICGNDPPRIDRIFRRSGLYREKWDRADYRQRTIAKALEDKTAFYRPGKESEIGWAPQWPQVDSDAHESEGDSAGPRQTDDPAVGIPQFGVANQDPIARARTGRAYPMTDLGNAERFAALFKQDARHVNGLGWLVWDKRHWRIDDNGAVVRLAKKCVRGILGEAAACAEAAASSNDESLKAKLTGFAGKLPKWAITSESRTRLMAMIEIAQSLEPIACRVGELDADPWLFNCLNGTLDLRTGLLRSHWRTDLISKLAPVAFEKDADCPVWRAFLQRIFDNNEQMIAFVQRAVGSALSGVIREHVVHVLYGGGANGKSTFIETIATMLGDYATAAAPRLLIRRQGEVHPTELVDLQGARFVSSIETAEGGAFDEERVKALTGGDRIKARRMRQDFFEFPPTFKLFLATNHRPIVRGDDTGIWRRIRLWPFTVEIPPEEQDHSLKDKLRAELHGILSWCVQGCMAWQDDGLCEPPDVTEATQSYREEQDHFGNWFESCCVTPQEGEDVRSIKSAGGLLYQSYVHHLQSAGIKPLGNWKFSERLLKRPGIIRDRGQKSIYIGVMLTDEAYQAIKGQGEDPWTG